MNVIDVWSPKWSTRELLLARWKVGNDNEIRVANKNFPEPLYMSGERIRSYPVQKVPRKNQPPFEVYAVPIADFITLAERNDILEKAKALGQ